MRVALSYIEPRHRLDLLDRRAARSAVAFRRHASASKLPPHLAKEFSFHDPDQINPFASLQDNILFGRIADGRAGAVDRVSGLLREILEELGPFLCGARARAEIRDRIGRAPALAVAAPAARPRPGAAAAPGVPHRQPRPERARTTAPSKRSSRAYLAMAKSKAGRFRRALDHIHGIAGVACSTGC